MPSMSLLSRPITSGATIVSSAALVDCDRSVTERFPPADEPVRRLDADQQDLHVIPDLSGEQRWRSAHRERQRNNSGFDGNDVHCVPLPPGGLRPSGHHNANIVKS